MMRILSVLFALLVVSRPCSSFGAAYILNRYIEDRNQDGLPNDGASWVVGGTSYSSVDDELWFTLCPVYVGKQMPTGGSWFIDGQKVGSTQIDSGVMSGTFSATDLTGQMNRVLRYKYDFSNDPAFDLPKSQLFRGRVLNVVPVVVTAIPSALQGFHTATRKTVLLPAGSNPFALRKIYEAKVPIIFEQSGIKRLQYTVEIYSGQHPTQPINYTVEVTGFTAGDYVNPPGNPPRVTPIFYMSETTDVEPGQKYYKVWKNDVLWASGPIQPDVPIKLFDNNGTAADGGSETPPGIDPNAPPGTSPPSGSEPKNTDGTPSGSSGGSSTGGSTDDMNDLKKAFKQSLEEVFGTVNPSNYPAPVPAEGPGADGDSNEQKMNDAAEAGKDAIDAVKDDFNSLGGAFDHLSGVSVTVPVPAASTWDYKIPITVAGTFFVIDLAPYSAAFSWLRGIMLFFLMLAFWKGTCRLVTHLYGGT